MNRRKVIIKPSRVSSSTPRYMLGDAAGRLAGAPRWLSSTTTDPSRNMFPDPIPKRPRGTANVGAAARTFEFINDATSFVQWGTVFEGTLRNLPAFLEDNRFNVGVS